VLQNIEDSSAVLANPLSLVQPFMDNIQSEGEFSLFYFSGEYSHAIFKVPKDGDFRVQEEYGGDIQSVQPPRQLLDAGQHVLSLVDS
jgi:hypothetical protein